jgi:hypothetical protein
MRKKLTFFTIVLVIVAIMPLNAQDKALKNGFSVNLITGNPSAKNYGITATENDPNENNHLLLGFEVGNRWYLNANDKYGLGIMLNWLDVTFQSGKIDVPGDTVYSHVLNISVAEVGPIGTLALTSDIGFDVYYNIRPTYLNAGKVPFNEDMDGDGVIDEGFYGSNANAFGLTHTMGLSARWRSLALSCEYVLGNIRRVEGGHGNLSYGSQIVSANHFRVMLGFKF